jgi:hypothetical protein
VLGANGAHAAQAFELPLLQTRSSFGCSSSGISPTSSRKMVPIRQFKAAHALHDGAGECTFLVAEQLALEQSRRNRRTIQLHKCVRLPRAKIVRRPRDQLFPVSPGLDQMFGIAEVGYGYLSLATRVVTKKLSVLGIRHEFVSCGPRVPSCSYEDILQGRFNLPPIALLGSRRVFLWHASCTMCDRFSGAQRGSATNVRAIW